MNLTPEQKATLLANIQATPAALEIYQNGDLGGLADFYNGLASPEFIVWKTFVSRDDVMLNGFDWTRVDNLSAGKARIWEWINLSGGFNPSKPNIRAGIDATWVGTQADLAVRAAVYVHCKRSATRLEKVFATGTGSDAAPATMTLEGLLSFNDLIGL
jgi:hypothetical protein